VKHFCEELKAAREYKKVTLEEISAATKIDVNFLQALEDGRWDILPEPYIKGFLKAYAQSVGMNVLKVLKKYDELEKGVKPSNGDIPEDEQKLAPPEPPPPPVKSRFPAVKVRTYGLLYGLLVVAIVAVGLFLLSRKGAKTSVGPSHILQEPSAAIPTDTTASSAAVPDTQAAAPVVTPPVTTTSEPFLVEAVFSDPCYLEVVLDDSASSDYLFQAGQSKTWKPTKSLWLKLGNAGGAQISLNGKGLGLLGSVNQVVTLTLGPNGVIEKILGPVPAEVNSHDTL
jgi:cytoskeletal protein RodZ